MIFKINIAFIIGKQVYKHIYIYIWKTSMCPKLANKLNPNKIGKSTL